MQQNALLFGLSGQALIAVAALGFIAGLLGALAARALQKRREARKSKPHPSARALPRMQRHVNAPAWGRRAREEQAYNGR